MKPVTSDDPLAIFAKTPFTRLLGMQRNFSEGGKAQISLDPHADLGNVIGAVHGGVFSYAGDLHLLAAGAERHDARQLAPTLSSAKGEERAT